MMPDHVRRWLIVLIAGLLFLLSQFYRASVAVITPELIRDLAVDARGLSLLSAAFFYAFALTQIPISMYLDGIGPRLSMTVLSLVAAGGALIFAWGGSLSMLVTGRVLMGVGMACNLMGTLKLITLWFGPGRFATLSAFIFAIGTVGNLIAATPLVLMVKAVGWRNAFMAIAAINLLLTVLFYLVTRDRPVTRLLRDVPQAGSTQISEILAGLRLLIKEKDFWIISLGAFCRYGILAAVQALWAGPYLIKVIGISAVSAGNLLLLMSIGMALGSPAFGWLSDSAFQNRKGIVISGLLAMSLILIGLTRLSPGTGMIVLGFLFFSFGFFGAAGNIMYTHIKERMPLESAGAAMTGINFFTMFGVAVFLQGLGSMMQRLHPNAALGPAAFQDAFWFCAICLGGTACLYMLATETLGKKTPRAK